MDSNDDGLICAKELQERFTQGPYTGNSNLKLEDEFFDNLLAECDTNQDGYIDFNEFKKTMTGMLLKEKQNL